MPRSIYGLIVGLMNRKYKSGYTTGHEIIEGNEEEFPDYPVRGNISNRSWFEPRLLSDGVRLYSEVFTSFMPQYPTYKAIEFDLIRAKTLGPEVDKYAGRAIQIKDLHLTGQLFLPHYHEEFEYEPLTHNKDMPAGDLEVFYAIVVDHQHDPGDGSSLHLDRIFNVSGTGFMFPPMRNEDAAYLQRYEVLAYDLHQIRNGDLFKYKEWYSVENVSGTSVPLNLIRKARSGVSEFTRFGLAEIDLLCPLGRLGTAEPPVFLPNSKRMYFVAYIPNQLDHAAFSAFYGSPTMSIEYQLRYKVAEE